MAILQSGKQVAELFRKKVADPFGASYQRDTYAYNQTKVMKDKLDTLILELEKQEQTLYRAAQVDNIDEFNQKIQKLNNVTRLFTNEGINNLGLIDSNSMTKYIDQIGAVLMNNKQFIDSLQQLESNALDGTNKELSDLAISIFNDLLKDTKTSKFRITNSKFVSLGKFLSNFIVENGQLQLNPKANTDSFPELPRFVKKRLDLIVKPSNKVGTNSQKVNLSNTEFSLVLDRNQSIYPLWALNPDTTEQKMTLVRLWKATIMQKIGAITENNDLVKAFDISIEQMIRTNLDGFFVTTINSFKGLMNEILNGAILVYFTGDISGIQAGSLRNNLESIANQISSWGSGKQLGVDYVLNGLGFQVKDYKLKEKKLDQISNTHFITLGLNKEQLPTFLKQIQATYSGEIESVLNYFFSIYNFNKPYQTPELEKQGKIYEKTVYSMMNVYYERIKDLFFLSPEEILRLSQDIEVTNFLDKNRYYKTFFVINDFYFPASFLLRSIRAVFFAHTGRQSVYQKEELFKFETTYSGPTAEDKYLELKNNNKPIQDSTKYVPNISSQVRITAQYIFNIEQSIISKIKQMQT